MPLDFSNQARSADELLPDDTPPIPAAAPARASLLPAGLDFSKQAKSLSPEQEAMVMAGFEEARKVSRAAVQPPDAPSPEESSVAQRLVVDPLLSLSKGIIGVPEAVVGLGDLVTGGRTGKALEDLVGYRPGQAKKFIEEQFTPEQKAANRTVDEAKGFTDTAVAAIQNPSTIAHSIIESAPSTLAGGALARGALAVAPRVGPAVAAAVGEGALSAGQTAEQVRQETRGGLLTSEQAQVAAGSGFLTGLLGFAGGKLARKLGIADVDSLLAGAKTEAAKKGVVRRVLEGAVSEGIIEELPQSAQEQIAQNVATGKPWDEGLDKAAVMGMFAGMGMGVGSNLTTHEAPPQPRPMSAEEEAAALRRLDAEHTASAPSEADMARERRAMGMKYEPPAPPEPGAGLELVPKEPPPTPPPAGPADNGIDFPSNEAPPANPLDRAAAVEQAIAQTEAAQRERAAGVDYAPTPITPAPARELALEQPGTAAQDAQHVADFQPFLREQQLMRANAIPTEAWLEQGDLLGRKYSRPTVDVMVRLEQLAQTNPVAAARAYALIESFNPDAQEAQSREAATAPVPAAPAPDAGAQRGGEEGRAQPGPAAAAAAPAPAAEAGQPVAPATVDAPAHEAATSPKNDRAEPTDGQKEAGNYKKGHMRVAGLEAAIENPAGSRRRPEWPALKAHYGYFKRTKGADGDQVDAFFKVGTPLDWSGPIFVVDQMKDGKGKKAGGFDEHKVVVGVKTAAEARTLYASNYTPDWKVGPVTELTVPQFKAWLASDLTTRPMKSLSMAEWATLQGEDKMAEPAPVKADAGGAAYDRTSAPRFARVGSEDGSQENSGSADERGEDGLQTIGEGRFLSPDTGSDGRDQPHPQRAHAQGQGEDVLRTVGGGRPAQGWARATRIRRKSGDPIRVFRGSKHGPLRVTDFQSNALGKASGNPSSGLGVWFTQGRDEASGYGEVFDHFLDIRNPKYLTFDNLPAFDTLEHAIAWRKRLQEHGYDGLILDGRALGKSELHFVAFTPEQVITAPAKSKERDALFERRPQANESGSSKADVERWLGPVVKRGAVPVEVVQSVADLPFKAPTDVKGAYLNGRIWAVADNLADAVDAERTIARHEVTHAGIDWLFGSARAREVALKDIVTKNLNVARRAASWRIKYGADVVSEKIKLGRAREAAQKAMMLDSFEEALAYIAQDTGNVLHGWRKFVAVIQQALRARGFTALANWMEKATNAEVVEFLDMARRATQDNESGAGREEPAWHREPGVRFSRASREEGLPAEAGEVLAPLDSHIPLRDQEGYAAAKTRGDTDAAMRVVRSVMTTAVLRRAVERFGRNVFYLATTAPEAGGDNVLPHALAKFMANATGARADVASIVQVNRAHHTGASKMERLVSRPLFNGPVTRGERYVLVDDVVTRGGTMAELADHVRSQGGQVAGIVALANAGSGATLIPAAAHIRAIKANPDLLDATRRIFRVEPDALTRDEAEFISSHGDARAFRDRALATARQRGVEVAGRDPGEESGSEGVNPKFARSGGNQPRRSWAESEPAPVREALRKAGVLHTEIPLKERVKSLTKVFGTEWRQGLFDQFRPILDLDERAYMMARLSRATDGALEALMFHGRPRLTHGALDVDTTGGGLLSKLQKLEGEQDRFFAWVAGNRAAELKKQGRENLFTDQDISALRGLNGGSLPSGRARRQVYWEVLGDFNAYGKSVLDIAEQTGLINAEARAMWRSDFYVPFYRIMDEETVTGPKKGGSGLVNQQAFKKLKGGTQELNDLLANTLRNWSHLLSASMKNQAAARTMDAAISMGIASEIPEHVKGALSVMRDGKAHFYDVSDPQLVDALTSLDFNGFHGWLMKALALPKKVLTFGVTTNPAFRVKNLIRDTMSAIAQAPLSFNPIKNLADGFAATRHGSPERARLLAGGGMIRFGAMLEGSRADRVKRLIDAGVKAETILDTPAKVQGLLTKSWKAYQEGGDRAEAVNRAALYRQLRAKGVDHLEASYEARDLLDFSMQGKWALVRFLGVTVPFFNARLQGLYKLGRAGGRSKAGAARLATVIAAAAIMDVALLAWYGGDADWDDREEWDRDNYYWFKAEGVAYRIPKAFEIGAIGTLAMRTVELAYSHDEDAGKRFRKRIGAIIGDQLNMNPTPQLVKPMIDLYANRDSFTDRPIESGGMEKLENDERIARATTLPAQMLAKIEPTDRLSPVEIDFLAKAYFGWIGMSAMKATDKLLDHVVDSPERPASGLRGFPVVSDFVRELPTEHSRYITLFYEQMKEVDEAYNTWREQVKMGRADRAEDYLDAKREKIERHSEMTHTRDALAALNREARKIEEATDISASEKRDELDDINARRGQLAKRFVKQE